MNLARPWVFIRIACVVSACVLGACVLGACGQKGPLVLPDSQKQKHSIPATSSAPAHPAGADGAAPPAPAPGASQATDSPAHP